MVAGGLEDGYIHQCQGQALSSYHFNLIAASVLDRLGIGKQPSDDGERRWSMLSSISRSNLVALVGRYNMPL